MEWGKIDCVVVPCRLVVMSVCSVYCIFCSVLMCLLVWF